MEKFLLHPFGLLTALRDLAKTLGLVYVSLPPTFHTF
jgi:hypothetical protein